MRFAFFFTFLGSSWLLLFYFECLSLQLTVVVVSHVELLWWSSSMLHDPHLFVGLGSITVLFIHIRIFYIPYWFTAAQSNLHWFCAHFEVTNVLVLVLYRHAMQNAMVAYPETRKARLRLPGKDVLRSEVKWSEFRWSLLTKLGERKLDAQILEVRCCTAVPFLTLPVACFLPTWWTLGQRTWYQYVATAAAPFSATQHDAVFTIIWYSMNEYT